MVDALVLTGIFLLFRSIFINDYTRSFKIDDESANGKDDISGELFMKYVCSAKIETLFFEPNFRKK